MAGLLPGGEEAANEDEVTELQVRRRPSPRLALTSRLPRPAPRSSLLGASPLPPTLVTPSRAAG